MGCASAISTRVHERTQDTHVVVGKEAHTIMCPRVLFLIWAHILLLYLHKPLAHPPLAVVRVKRKMRYCVTQRTGNFVEGVECALSQKGAIIPSMVEAVI